MDITEPPSKRDNPDVYSGVDLGEAEPRHTNEVKRRPSAIETAPDNHFDSGDITDLQRSTSLDRPLVTKPEDAQDEELASPSTPKKEQAPTSPNVRVSEPVWHPSQHSIGQPLSPTSTRQSIGPNVVSEWSHQKTVHQEGAEEEKEEELEWQEMPAFASYDMYDDDNKLIARERRDSEGNNAVYEGIGGAGKGYTRVQVDEDAQSATSLDENTAYLFKDKEGNAQHEDDETLRDPLEQLQANKTLLNDNQRIAYVGVVRLAMADMLKKLSTTEKTKAAKKNVEAASDSMALWSQKIMVRLYAHMELEPAEQIMIEQLAEHGLTAYDLTPSLMENARVNNPAVEAEEVEDEPTTNGAEASSSTVPETSQAAAAATSKAEDEVKPFDTEHGIYDPPPYKVVGENDGRHEEVKASPERQHLSNQPNGHRDDDEGDLGGAPPPYNEHDQDEVPEAQALTEMPTTSKIDIDLRWTVLCDLFLILIVDGSYDSRSRYLLEQVGNFLSISWLDIRRFEKRVTDALEMAEAADKENWNEADHMEARRKRAMKRRLMMMGLATVGGGLVIGLSAGLLAPVIGAGLAAGFTTIGVTGTSTFLAGAGGAAVIGTGSAIAGGTIGVRAANRRTGAVKTFEYRPLFNNKRVNLIVTVSGWMSSKVDDVRLPFSTVDPVMGDIYSILWEPDMLTSMGDTINILASEALTQTLQQILGATILVSLMAALQLPVVLSKLSYLIDNPWSVSLARADLAGLILADSIIDRNLGNRPITLIGYSLGSRLIVSCLKELAKKGAYGLVHNVFLFGTPAVIKKDDYLRMRTVASGRFVNGYATNDWILGYLFRATGGGIMRVAGLAKIDLPGIENVNCTEWVPGHMAYRQAMPKVLKHIGFAITSEEFSEIEDPDPENHEKRQRELVNEIEEARKEIAQKPEKRRWGIFKRQKYAQKKQWETYDERMRGHDEEDDPEKIIQQNPETATFDITAIQKEVASLAAQGIEVRELETTQPALRIHSPSITNGSDTSSPRPSSSNLRETRSYEGEINLPSRPGIGSSRSYYADTHAASEDGISMSFEPISPTQHRNHDFFNYDDHDHDHNHDGEITMSFEPTTSPYEGNKRFFQSHSPTFPQDDSHHSHTISYPMEHTREYRNPFDAPHDRSHYLQRRESDFRDSPRLVPPEPTKSRTPSPQHSPAFAPPPAPPPKDARLRQEEHVEPAQNVWADFDDDDEFGKEKEEPELTFA